MKVAHIVPPEWEKRLGRGEYRMTFVPWALQHPESIPKCQYLMLDHGTFERDLTLPELPAILKALHATAANEVVLPDVLGDPLLTLAKAIEALGYLPSAVRVMFVPQASTFQDWKQLLDAFLPACRTHRPVIGLSSLRRPGSLRAQVGSRVPMMRYLHARNFQMHLLGLCSVSKFLEAELPTALECNVRGLDSCEAFALGVRELKLTEASPRLFLSWRPERYESLTESQLELIRENMQILDSWVKGE